MEAEAKKNLLRQGFDVYLPQWVELKRRQGVWKRVQSPMFPRYLFVRASHTNQSIAPIRSTWGVSQLVRFGTQPAWADARLISEIRQLECSRNRLDKGMAPFVKGDQVQVLDGPFKGISADVLSCDQQRVILLLEVLGKTQHLEFPVNICQVK